MIEAVIIGALTAWYLGVRAGIIAAIATGIALVIAAVVPGMTLAVYALVLAWAAALYFFGPKLGKKGGAGKSGLGWMGTVTGTVGQATGWAKKMFGRNS
jgi:hypothetical protein